MLAPFFLPEARSPAVGGSGMEPKNDFPVDHNFDSWGSDHRCTGSRALVRIAQDAHAAVSPVAGGHAGR
jgi:hypothetical protein